MTAARPQAIPEPDDAFLALWPHRYDFIWAPRPQELGDRPQWRTESRYPLSDRAIQTGQRLYGVRCGKETAYLMIDLDAQSRYHPRRHPQALRQLLHALEAIGLVGCVICRSSASGGLHLFFPLDAPVSAYQLGTGVTNLLEQAGFLVKPGQLEIFPNRKPYRPDQPSLYNAHRLPLQDPDSFLLDADGQPLHTSPDAFVQQWRWATRRNQLDHLQLQHYLRRRPTKRLTQRAEQFLSDLDTEIEAGWSDSGQTNHLLGRIALREYIFYHHLHNGAPLTGEALTQRIQVVAIALPGYADYCGHQPDIAKRAAEWARAVEGNDNRHHFAHAEASLIGV